jgi:hypothetical protein
MEIKIKTTFNDVPFTVYYEGLPRFTVELVSVYIDEDGNDLVNMLSDTVLQGLTQACVANEYERDYMVAEAIREGRLEYTDEP